MTWRSKWLFQPLYFLNIYWYVKSFSYFTLCRCLALKLNKSSRCVEIGIHFLLRRYAETKLYFLIFHTPSYFCHSIFYYYHFLLLSIFVRPHCTILSNLITSSLLFLFFNSSFEPWFGEFILLTNQISLWVQILVIGHWKPLMRLVGKVLL